MIRLYLTVWLLLLSAFPAYGYMLSGKVLDQEGKPVAYASVYVENTTQGVVTNVMGEYFLELEKGEYSLVFSVMGFRKKIVPITVEGNQVLNVTLEPEDVSLETVEITTGRKDPAYEIMEKVIDRKKDYIRQFDTYTCETYLKVSLEREKMWVTRQKELEDSLAQDSIAQKDTVSREKDTSFILDWEDEFMGSADTSKARTRKKLNFIESHSTTYFERPDRYKSIVHAYRDMTERPKSFGTDFRMTDEGMQVVNEDWGGRRNPLLFYTDVSDADFNFYLNLVEAFDLSDRPLISPLSSTSWRLTYKYRLVDEFLEKGRVIYKIEVTPRLKAGPYFEGYIFIVDKEWALKSVNLTVNPSTMGFFSYFQVIHNYEKTKDNRWILVREDYYYNAKEGKRRYYGNSIALHKDYQLDVEHPKNWFRNELRRVEDDARDRDSAFWDGSRPLTLREVEREFIHDMDSIKDYLNSSEYHRKKDSAYNKFKVLDPFLEGIGWRRHEKGMAYFIQPLITQIRPFGVGGYRHAFGGFVSKEWASYNRLLVSGELNYGFKNRDLKGYGKVEYTYLPKKFASGYVKYGNVYSLVNSNETITAMLSRGNYVSKIYFGAGHKMEVVNGLMADIGLEFADRQAIKNLALAQWSQDVFGSLNDPVEFDPYREFLLDIKLKFTPFQKYQTEPRRKIILGSKWPEFNLHYKKAIPGFFDSEMDFDYLEVGANHEFRPGTWGISRWSFSAGRFLNSREIRFTDFRFFRGSDPFFFANPLRAMQLLGPSISTKNGFFQANYLHDFGGMLMDKIPLLNRTALQITSGAGILLIEDNNFFHGEIYSGLQIPFTLWRQRFKFGTYYVTSYSTHDRAISGQVKFGLTFFDTRKNSWQY